MAVSLLEGLFAGAAGVADYTEEARKTKQARMDKTIDLQNEMAMHRAKSAYAAKLNEYQASQAEVRALQSVPAQSLAEQVYLHKKLGYSEKHALRAASMAIKSKQFLQRSKPMAFPELNMPELSAGQRATNPLTDWIANYLKGDNPYDSQESALGGPTEPTQDISQPAQAEGDLGYGQSPYPQGPQGGQVTPASAEVSFDKTITDDPAQVEVENAMGRKSAEVPNEFELRQQAQADEFIKALDLEEATKPTIRDVEGYGPNGEKGKHFVYLDSTGVTKQTFVPAGAPPRVLTETLKTTDDKGNQYETDVYLYVEDGKEVKEYGEKRLVKQTGEIVFMNDIDMKDFLNRDPAKGPIGDSYRLFPMSLDETLGDLAGDDWLSDDADSVASARSVLATEFQRARTRIAKNPKMKLTAEMWAHPEIRRRFEALMVSEAFLNSFDVDKIVEAINNEELPPNVLLNPFSIEMKKYQPILSQLDVVKEGKTKKYLQPVRF